MADDKPTGNPVFDYRAGFRARADRVQRALIVGGLFLSVVCGVVFLFADPADSWRRITAYATLACAVLCLLGIAWGFYWRSKIRSEFRALYGPAADKPEPIAKSQ
jgi:hypothetical protein